MVRKPRIRGDEPTVFDHAQPCERRLIRINRFEGAEFVTLDLIPADGFLEVVSHPICGQSLGESG